ncbi:hypothetical protein [Streptomyces sp. NPDC001970]
MKKRHVRAIAVVGLVLITLTGARGSRGGGCDNDSSSSTSTSGGSTTGGSHSDDDDDLDIGTSGGSVSGGSDATDEPTYSGPTGAVDAKSDVEIKYCSINRAETDVRGQLLIKNETPVDQTYDITLHFQGDDPEVPLVAKFDDVTVAAKDHYFTEASAPYTGSGKGLEFRECEVVSATRTASP